MASSTILKRSLLRLRRDGFLLSPYSASFSTSSPIISSVARQPHSLFKRQKSQRLHFSALPTSSDNNEPTPIVVFPPSSAAIVSKEDESHEETKRIRLSEVRNFLNSKMLQVFHFPCKNSHSVPCCVDTSLGSYIRSSQGQTCFPMGRSSTSSRCHSKRGNCQHY